MIGGWRAYALAAGAGVLLSLAAWTALQMHGKAQYSAGERAEKARQHTEELEAWRVESERLSSLSVDLQGRIDKLQTVAPKIIERYTTHVRESAPLPAGCIIDPVRLQHINAAIVATNAARQFGADMQTSTSAGD